MSQVLKLCLRLLNFGFKFSGIFPWLTEVHFPLSVTLKRPCFAAQGLPFIYEKQDCIQDVYHIICFNGWCYRASQAKLTAIKAIQWQPVLQSLPMHSYFLSSPAHSGFSEPAAAESSCLPRGRGVFFFKASCRLSDSAGLFSVSFYTLHTTLHVCLLTCQVEARWTTAEILVCFTLHFVLTKSMLLHDDNRAAASKQTGFLRQDGQREG